MTWDGYEHGAKLVESAKRLGYHVTQLADADTPLVPGVDVCRRADRCAVPPMVYRVRRLLDLKPPFAVLDADAVIQHDIADGFSEDHDATVIRRMEKRQPHKFYSFGLVWIRNRDFVADMYARVQSLSAELQDWYGDQQALYESSQPGRFKVREIVDPLYSYIPKDRGDIRPEARVIQYKGLRKGWLKEAA